MRAILTYHSIDDSGSPVSVSRAQFRAHCAFLASGRVPVVTLQQLLQHPHVPDAVAITFDDGFANVWTDAAPQLADSGLPATVFVVSNHVGGFNDWGGRRHALVPHLPLMSWEQLGHLTQWPMEIGAHTATHPHLPAAPTERLEDELDGCVDRIHAELGVRPSSFAYPYGAVDARVASAVRERFAVGCTTELRALSATDDCARLPRLDMYYLRSRGLLERWGSAAFRSLVWIRARGRWTRDLLSREPEFSGAEP